MEHVKVSLLEDYMIPGLVKVINDAYLFEATFKKDPTRINSAELQKLKDSGPGRCYALILSPEHPYLSELPSLPSDGVVGHIYVEYRSDFGYFGLLAVHTALHGKGLGNYLLEYAEETMRKEGLKKSGCSVASPIPRLQGYYERRGYKTTGETEPWESDNLKEKAWFIMMRKDL